MKALKVFVAVILVFLFYFCFAETRVYPYVEMSVKPKAVDVNEPMLITITGYDNYDIEMISLYYNGVWHDYECKGIQKECSNTWEVRQKTPGSYLYHAYAIDNVGIYTPKLVSIRATVYEERADYFEAAVGNKKSIEVNKKFEEDGYYYYDLNIGKPIYSMTIKATVRFRQENGYARFVLRGSDGKEYLIYEIYPLVSKYNYVEVSGICEETCALNGIIPQTIKIQNAYADVYLKEINYAESPGLISEGAYKASFVTHVEKLKHGQQIAKMETASQNMKNKGAYWVAGITQLAITPYQEKKKIFGGEVPVFYGAEYSLYGTFQLPEPKRACECAEDSECSGGQTCDGCNCKSNEVKCEITDYYCEGDVLYWKDSCGNKGIQSDCGAGGGVCEGKNCVIKQPPCQKKTCASYYDVKCGTLDDGCNGTITCPNNCGPDKECQTVLGEGNCIPKAVQPKPPANCPGCYQTVEECKAANGGGLTSRCKCKEGVYCEFDTTCNCYKYSSCTESVCGGGGCTLKSCAVEYKGKCGTFPDGCGGELKCECPSGQTCNNTGLCENKPVCPGCYQTVEECKAANGGGLTSRCKCKEGVYCELDTTCNCYKYSSCTESVCGGGGCTLKSCAVEYKGKCGTFPDGCGGELKCECPSGQTCNNETGLCEGTPSGNQGGSDQGGTTKPPSTCACTSDVACKIRFNMDSICCENCTCVLCNTCTDTDLGENYKIKGTVRDHGFTYTDYCTADGSLIEYFCFDFDTMLSKKVKCESGSKCIDGACVKDSGGGGGGGSGGQQPICADSDGGKDIFTFGKVTYNNQNLSDYCEPGSTNQLTEQYCENNEPKSSIFTCPVGYACISGKCAQPSQSSGCTDSDGGKDIYTKGVVEYNGNYYPDMCSSSGGIIEHYCETSASGCDTNSVKYYQSSCPTGYRCIDGACQKDTGQPSTCTDSDMGRNYYVRGTTTDPKGSYIDKCSADGKTLYEYYCVWDNAQMEENPTPYDYICKDGAFVEANPSSNCSDSDGGRDIYKKGTVNENGILSTDECTCGGSKVKEYSCSKGRTVVAEEYCPTGYTCKDGACVQGSSPEVCNDSDGGKNFDAKGTVVFGGQTYVDFCNGSVVNEHYCESNQGRSTTYNCPYGCSDGACLSSSYGSGTRGKCTDSDGGINRFVRGTVEYESTMAIILRDYCQDNKSVKEYFCQNDEPLETIVPCPDICENGACR